MKITVEELEEVVGFKISDQNKKLVNDFNLEYNELTQEERDEVILNAINILNDDKLEYAGKHRLIKWENGWNENLELLKENKNPNVLIPKYFNKYNIARWRGKYVKALTDFFDYKLQAILVDIYLHKYVNNDYQNLFEFGCGPAYHLLRFGEFNKNINLIGLDWTVASQNIIKEINKLNINTKISGYNFNYFEPDYNINIPENSAVFTCCSLEQINDNYKEFVNYLLDKKPNLCIHFENCNELLDDKSLVDKLSILYSQKRKYLSGYLTYLRELEKLNKLDIITAKRTYGGGYFVEAYPVIIWKPK